jgi:capsular polysaccharide biosynthesis protein
VDLQLYFRVIRRFGIIVVAGLVLAILLAFFSFFRVTFNGGSPKVQHRQSETYSSSETLLITTGGAADFRVGSPATSGVLGGIAMNYAEIANGDAVKLIMRKSGPINGTITAAPGVDQITHRIPLPFVSISGVASDPRTAISLASRGSRAFREYVAQQQDAVGVPAGQRIRVRVLSSASYALVIQKRRKTVPVVVFLTTLIATLGLVFILENLRPRVAPVRIREDDEDERQRRIARGA